MADRKKCALYFCVNIRRKHEQSPYYPSQGGGQEGGYTGYESKADKTHFHYEIKNDGFFLFSPLIVSISQESSISHDYISR